MVAWQSNPNLGALIADMGPYIGADWPPAHPPLDGVFPIDAGEVDYWVLDPAVDNYLTFSSPSSSSWANSYTYEGGAPGANALGFSEHKRFGSTGPTSGAHIYVAWYDYSYHTVPAAPSVTPESLIRNDYSALGTIPGPVYHWGPWITPANQTFTFSPASGGAGTYAYGTGATMADAIAAPGTEGHGASTWLWTRDSSSTPCNYSIGTFDLSLGLTQYAQENNPSVTVGQQGFYNAKPTLPTGAVLVQQETVWDHTHYADMLASVVGNVQFDLIINETNPGSGFIAQDVNVLFWAEPATAMQNYDTFFGFVNRTAGVPTQSDLDSAYAAPKALVTMPATTTSITASMTFPVSYLYTGMLPYRDDLSPSVRVAVAIAEGILGTDPAAPPPGALGGRELHGGGFSVTVTYRPPRYRFKFIGPGDTVIPPLRQFHRDDGLAGGALSQRNPSSRQFSTRAGINGSYL